MHLRALTACHLHPPTLKCNARTRTLAACALAWINSCLSSTRSEQQTKFQSKTTPSPKIPLTKPEPWMAYGRPSMPAPKAMLTMLRMVSRELPSPPEVGGAGPVGATSLLLSMLLLPLAIECCVSVSRCPVSVIPSTDRTCRGHGHDKSAVNGSNLSTDSYEASWSTARDTAA